MLGLYTSRDVQKLVRRLREEYGAVLERQKEVVAELKEQNRNLLARVSELESERDSVSDAIVHAVAAGERIKRESAMEAENERKELVLLTEKYRALTEQIGEEQPDAGDEAAYSAFLQRLQDVVAEPPEAEEPAAESAAETVEPVMEAVPETEAPAVEAAAETAAALSEKETEPVREAEPIAPKPAETDAFNMDDVLAPKEPLNLKKLCIDLGLMEEDSE